MKKELLNTIKIITLALLITVGINYLYAWSGPQLPPPDGNVSAPINAGSAAQSKSGMLAIGKTTAPTAGYALDVNGVIFGNAGVFAGLTLANGTQGDGKVLSSNASGNATWSSVTTNSFAFKRSAIHEKDSVVWCPSTHPYVISCSVTDDQAPSAGTLNDLGNAGCSTSDGLCNQTNVRGSLGQNDMYLETVKKDGPVWGCLAYDSGHTHQPYRLDLMCGR
jgi:hypothetical protein